jgi:hypothetical protein
LVGATPENALYEDHLETSTGQRLHARGELTEDYHANLGEGFDKRCVGFLRVNYPELRERMLAGGIDEEILEWCFEKGRQLNDDDRLIWSHFISKFGWSDFATARSEELKQKHGVSDRKDIMTIADAIDLDEKRKS